MKGCLNRLSSFPLSCICVLIFSAQNTALDARQLLAEGTLAVQITREHFDPLGAAARVAIFLSQGQAKVPAWLLHYMLDWS